MRFFAFLWDFVVGDDWLAALGIAIGIGLAALTVWAGVDAWWLIPLVVVAVLATSLRRAVRAS